MKLRIAGPDRLVDITRIPELKGVRRTADGALEIGAATTYAELAESADVWTCRPVVAEVASLIADVQVRNRGTIGGNVCLNLPTNHFPPVLVAVGAELTVAGPDGERRVPAEQFFESTFVTAVQPGELLTAIHVPAREPSRADAFSAMSAGVESQSIVHVVVSLRWDGEVRDARVVLGCVAPVPARALAVERALEGAPDDEGRIRAAVDGLASTLTPVGDVNASSAFKAHAAEVLVRRATLKAIRSGATG
jgi:carbon-monoxide dehydrogenase medium subunit